MAEFINTVDVLGDDAVMDSIIDRTITEFNDDTIETVGGNAFNGCAELTSVDLPNCKTIGGGAFAGCSTLTGFNFESVMEVSASAFAGALTGAEVYIPNNVNMQYNAFAGSALAKVYAPNQEGLPLQAFQNCPSLVSIKFPALKYTGSNQFSQCRELKIADFSALIDIGSAFINTWSLDTLILRREDAICTLSSGGAWWGDRLGPLDTGTGYIYVPRALLDSYKVATNWSKYANQLRALEDYTVDGTVDGEVLIHNAVYQLRGVSSSNMTKDVGNTYRTTLTSNTDHSISEVAVTMGGVDVTSSVYDPDTGEVVIDTVTGDITIDAKIAVENVTIVKSLNSDGASYIMTDFVPDDSTVFTFEGYDEKQDNGYESYFGVKGNFTFRLQMSGSQNSLILANKYIGVQTPDTRLIQFDVANNSANYNGVSYSGIFNGVGWTEPLGLFSMINANGTANSPGKFNLYKSTVTQNGVLTHEWLPALDADNTPCLYDAVQKTFLYNAGSGTFTYDE